MTERQRRDMEDVARTDRRWFIVTVIVFAGSIGGLAVARAIFHATGPHPRVAGFVHRVERYGNGLLGRGGCSR